MNSIKMKTSVIFGVGHMTLGLVQKGLNSSYSSNKLDFLYEFLPQITMLLCLFGYMNLMIIIKWLSNYYGDENSAPSITTLMVGMFLELGKVEGRPLFPGQQIFSILMLCKSFF